MKFPLTFLERFYLETIGKKRILELNLTSRNVLSHHLSQKLKLIRNSEFNYFKF
jgi:hypothetical protein